MKLDVPQNTTSLRIMLAVRRASTGAYLTGITAAKLAVSYCREDQGNAGATIVSLSAGTRGTWTSGGVVEKDAANAPGEVEFGVPNAALASGSRWVTLTVLDAASNDVAAVKLEIELLGSNNDIYDTPSVRLAETRSDGLTPESHCGVPGSSMATIAFSRMVGTSLTADTPAFSVTGNGSGSGFKATGGDDSGNGGGNGVELRGGFAPDFGGHGLFSQGGPSDGIEGNAFSGAGFHGLRLGSEGGHSVYLTGSGDIWNGTAGTPVQVNTDRVMFSDVLGDQSAASDVDRIILPTGPASNSVLKGSRLRITSGVGQYQERTIINWNASAEEAQIDVPLYGGSPASGDAFQVLYDNSPSLDTSGNVVATAEVFAFQITALAQLFTLPSGEVYADAVSGSIVKEIASNAGGGGGDPLSNAVPGAYAAGTAGYKLGRGVPVDVTQSVPVGGAPNSLADCLNAARVQGFGSWSLSGTSLVLRNHDGTVARTFTLDSAAAPTSRS